MKKATVIIALAAAALLTSACVKDSTIKKNFASKKYFDSWMAMNYPDAGQTGLGAFIIEDEPGQGIPVGTEEEHPFILLDYIMMDLNGTITSYTDSSTAKQMHEFNSRYYYGPKVFARENLGLSSGMEDVLKGMRVGGRRKAVIPGWLSGKTRYPDAESYLDNVTGSDAIYDIKVAGVVEDIIKYQIDSIERYLGRNFHKVDSSKWGFYYIQTCPPKDTTAFKTGDAIDINYTGRLLNGLVFDTSVKDSAKVHGLELASEYGNTYFKYADTYTEFSLNGGSSGNLIDGFAYCLSLMKNGEKGIAIFTSDLGYKAQETEEIPAYSPLRFDLEIIGKQN